MFALLAAAGDIGAGAIPWITGVVVEFSEDTAAAGFFAKLLNISREQGAMRFGILIAAVVPLCAFIVHIVIMKIKNRESQGETANDL